VTGFGSFDNSTCKRVLDLLKPGDLTLGQVVIKRVAVVESAPRSRQITTPAPHRSVFYRPDALPATQPTASKH